ncbi:MAG TPA: Flp family type IVb pilin [Candidatus Rifleibacterium sp.]|nr:Flp family type IVb pilin [Candidatus Rifleibacterium sp.]HOI90490.1 Flp family type IVb pilin [Candidatus Rifleibacterium sp.]
MKPKSKRGQGLVEYALLLSLIALVCVSALVGFSGSLGNVWGEYSNSIGNAIDRSASN